VVFVVGLGLIGLMVNHARHQPEPIENPIPTVTRWTEPGIVVSTILVPAHTEQRFVEQTVSTGRTLGKGWVGHDEPLPDQYFATVLRGKVSYPHQAISKTMFDSLKAGDTVVLQLRKSETPQQSQTAIEGVVPVNVPKKGEGF
jgi:hypothetical protein